MAAPEAIEVLVQLLNEGVSSHVMTWGEVVRPEVVRLLPTPRYDPAAETWEFLPGALVLVARRARSHGEYLLAVAAVDEELHRCRICGLRVRDLVPWAELKEHLGENRCPCCGVVWGNEDTLDLACQRYRQEWLSKGAPWSRPEKRTKGWALEPQFQHIPAGFAGPPPSFGSPHATVRLQLRQGVRPPTPEGSLRCKVFFADNRDYGYDCRFDLAHKPDVVPGSEACVTATFLRPEWVGERLHQGARLELWDRHDLGSAEVLTVLEPKS